MWQMKTFAERRKLKSGQRASLRFGVFGSDVGDLGSDVDVDRIAEFNDRVNGPWPRIRLRRSGLLVSREVMWRDRLCKLPLGVGAGVNERIAAGLFFFE